MINDQTVNHTTKEKETIYRTAKEKETVYRNAKLWNTVFCTAKECNLLFFKEKLNNEHENKSVEHFFFRCHTMIALHLRTL